MREKVVKREARSEQTRAAAEPEWDIMRQLKNTVLFEMFPS